MAPYTMSSNLSSPSQRLDDLDDRIKPLVFELIARCTERGILPFIVNTLRTPEQQANNIAKGVSWTTNSRHLPQPPSGKSLAIDICPYEIYNVHGGNKLDWTASDPVWHVIGQIGESLGLVWGGRWKQKDMGHFELAIKSTEVKTV